MLELCFDQACLCHEQGVMKKVLKGATCAPLLSRVQALLKRLAKTAHNTFGEFEDTVSQDSTRHSVQDGTVHPLTAYVITYVKVECQCSCCWLESLRWRADLRRKRVSFDSTTQWINHILNQAFRHCDASTSDDPPCAAVHPAAPLLIS